MVLPYAVCRHPFNEEGFRSSTQRGIPMEIWYKEEQFEDLQDVEIIPGSWGRV
jgi:hypothetical protein